jgi:hypothetical protein
MAYFLTQGVAELLQVGEQLDTVDRLIRVLADMPRYTKPRPGADSNRTIAHLRKIELLLARRLDYLADEIATKNG